jgi:histidyl-tRNA synthetase
MPSKISPVKGTREFYPEQMALRNFIEENIRKVSQSFGYVEWDAPYIEPMELYTAKSGEELVKKQSFVFTDRGGDEVTLRPELTPSLARMVAAMQGELTFPLRWWSFGPFWRYEQPQRGRSREFFQWNLDLLGANSPEADAEVIAVAATFLRSIGLVPGRATIFVNDRRLINEQLNKINIPQNIRLGILNLMDRRSKMEPQKWDEDAIDLGLSQNQLAVLKDFLGDYDISSKSPELTRLFLALDALGVKEYIKFDPNITRGLLYYTGTVFEAFETSGSVKRAILGGGRYDNLLADVGGESLPATGFAMGDVVMGIVLKENGLIPEYFPTPAPVLVTVFDQSLLTESLSLSAELREKGINVIVYPEPVKLPKQFKFADKMRMSIALTIGPDEVLNNMVAVKNLRTGEQILVSREDVSTIVQKMVGDTS